MTIVAACMSCGPSKTDYENLQAENLNLQAQVDALNRELDIYKYSPDKLLADAQLAAKNEDKYKLQQILTQMEKYHPQANECAKVQALLNEVVAKEKAKAEAKRIQAEKERKERLKVVNKLKKKRDDVQGITWYYNPYFTHYDNRNLVSLYMGERGSSVWLRLKMSYSGDSWIFFEHAYLSYDGSTREILFDKYKDKESDNDTYVWEWIDVSVSDSDLSFLKKMVKGKSVKMQLTGKYTKTRTVSTNEIKAINEMIMAYEVLKAEK